MVVQSSHRRQLLRYLFSDFIMLNIGWLLFTLVRYSYLPASFRVSVSAVSHVLSGNVLLGQAVIPVLIMCVYWLSGYYNRPMFKSRMDELVNTIVVSIVGAVIIFFMVMVNDMDVGRMRLYEMIAMLWLCLFLPVYVSRLVITTRAVHRIRRGEEACNTLILGTGRSALEMCRRLGVSNYGNEFRIVGFVEVASESECWSRANAEEYGLPVFLYDDLQNVISEYDIRRIIVMPHHSGMRETSQLINRLFRFGCTIFVTPELYGVMVTRPRMRNVAGEPLIDISHVATSQFTVNCKRVADIVVSAITLVLLSPVYLALTVAVRRSSAGPVIYRQERIGYHKHPFNILKFRTMYIDAETNGPALSTLDDPRVTPIGHFMRKYRLDELPQFWNVLKGDMSLVGPRPERDYYIRQILEVAPYYNLIHQVRPGITSWGMVKYGYATSVDQMVERLRYDMIYIDNVSLAVDLKILFYTVNTVLTGKGL